MAPLIRSPDDPNLAELCQRLSEHTAQIDRTGEWPGRSLQLCGEYGVYEWFLPHEWGGQAWSELDVVHGYLRLSAACLTTTFVITQRTGACKRLAASENGTMARTLLPDLVRGHTFATVGISHLTTSRQHVSTPVLRASEATGGFLLDGYSPWVTGAAHAQTVVIGATLKDGQQILAALPTEDPGVTLAAPEALVGLSASHTGRVECQAVHLPRERVLAGPCENVMATGVGAGTGGLQTSTLAIGLASSAVAFLQQEAQKRSDLKLPAQRLHTDHANLQRKLLALAAGEDPCSSQDLRERANSLALRSSQAALAAAKGSGYVVGHPAGRWCREALFFLVWSCPQPVMAANLCELAGIGQ